jgi:hypothetical protein
VASLAQVVESGARRAELVAVLVEVALEPARPDAEDEAAVADVVDGAGHVGEQVGVAVGVARDERADLDPAGLLGPRAEHRPALVVLAVRLPVQREEVVPREGDVDAHLLDLREPLPDHPVVRVLRLQLDPDADRPVRARRTGV